MSAGKGLGVLCGFLCEVFGGRGFCSQNGGVWFIIRLFCGSLVQGFLIFGHFFAKIDGFFTVFCRNLSFLNVFWAFFCVFFRGGCVFD